MEIFGRSTVERREKVKRNFGKKELKLVFNVSYQMKKQSRQFFGKEGEKNQRLMIFYYLEEIKSKEKSKFQLCGQYK